MSEWSLSYTPPPTVRNMLVSNSFGRMIAGPVGSGKTYGMIIELLRRIAEQKPGADGLRHSNWAIIRQTLKQIKDTILPDVQKLLQGIQEYRVSDSSIRIWFGDIRATILLIPLDELKDQRRLLSLQLTGAWLSEFIEIDINLLGPIAGRIGRFPSGIYGTPTWKGIIGDTNFPTEGSDWHIFMESLNPQWEIFKQPGGLTKDAENLQWLNQTDESLLLPEDDPLRLALGRAYYERLVAASSEEYTTRYVHAQYGTDPSGIAVFKGTYYRKYHVQKNVEVVPNKMLLVGQDFGRNPWALITQMDHKGCLRVLEEVASPEMGLERHIRENLRPALNKPQYMGKPVMLIGDPAGNAKSSLFEINEFDLLKACGFAAYPAPTNDPDLRLQAVESFMGKINGIIIDEDKCPTLIQGLEGSYRFAKSKGGEIKPRPDKSGRWSHVQDDLQYVCLVANNPGAYGDALSQAMRGRKPVARRMPVSAWT